MQPSPWRSRTEHGFGGDKGGPERSDSRAPPKACVGREVCAANLQPGSPFFAYFLWRSKESKWPRCHKAQTKTIRKRIKPQHIFKIIHFVLLCLPVDCRIKFGNDGFTFQAAFDKLMRNFISPYCPSPCPIPTPTPILKI